MADWLRRGFGAWHACEPWQAQLAADSGRPVVAVFDPPERDHGHIALLVPAEGRPGIWIAQAGARNYRRAPLLAGFGVHAEQTHFWSHQ